MAASLLVGSAVGGAARSRLLWWCAVGLLSLPVLIVPLLVVLLGGGVTADATGGASARLRLGSVPVEYEPLVQRAASTCPGITAPLLAAQLDAESGWNPRAVSPVGARGLAQFMPGTWDAEGLDGDRDGERDPFNPADAIASQASFMCKLLAAVTVDQRLTGGRFDLALASYNAGLGAVQRYRGVPPYVETQAYVRRIRTLMAGYTAAGAFDGGGGPPGQWVRPISGPITSGFGPRWGRLHAGVDFAAPTGTPVYAASNGTVVAAGTASGFGKWVKLAHAGGVTSVYGHISAWHVNVGSAVQAGQLIASSGNEGRSTGPHLHLEVHQHGVAVDPIRFFADHGASMS